MWNTLFERSMIKLWERVVGIIFLWNKFVVRLQHSQLTFNSETSLLFCPSHKSFRKLKSSCWNNLVFSAQGTFYSSKFINMKMFNITLGKEKHTVSHNKQLVHSFSVNIRISQPSKVMFTSASPQWKSLFSGWQILTLTSKECINCIVLTEKEGINSNALANATRRLIGYRHKFVTVYPTIYYWKPDVIT